MIYTVTFNPSLDYYLCLETLTQGSVNRAHHSDLQVGGKGINVSLVLRELGIESTVLGFKAGFVGQEIENRLQSIGVQTDLITLAAGCSRINVKLKSGQETDINASGPVIDKSALEQLHQKLSQLKCGDTLVLAGSVPTGCPSDIYARILKELSPKGVRLVVDATGELLTAVLPDHPFLIKPNHHELAEIIGKSLDSVQEIIAAATRLQQMGACNVLVSMAGEGALLLNEKGELYRAAAPEGEVRGSVGAGDSMVAGFLAGLDEGDWEQALKFGIAAGSATAFSNKLATKQEILNLLQKTDL